MGQGGDRTSQSFYDFCVDQGKEHLLEEWDAEKNAPLTPRDITYGSRKKLWWKCGAGHSWEAVLFTRSRGCGCPFCRGLRAWRGGNDLASRAPGVSQEWHPTLNGALTPEDVTVGSHRSVWWLCPKGHAYRSIVKSRTLGTGCPYCAGRAVLPEENSLAALCPDLAREWDAEKNEPLTPKQVTSGTDRKVWWKGPCGHIWRSSVASRVAGAGCPYCAGKAVLPEENSLAAVFPEIAAQWDIQKNGALLPDMVTISSNRTVWWRCPLGHSYRAGVSGRTGQRSGCPYCTNRKVLPGFNDLETTVPEVAAQWHPTLNGNLTPRMVVAGCHRRAWWKCSLGHVWKAAIYSRAGAQRCGCPVCAGDPRRTRVMRDNDGERVSGHFQP